jgi:hypothetical protein
MRTTAFKFSDGWFTFWSVHYGPGDRRVVFRVREDNRRIKYYDRLLPATAEEVCQWLDGHPEFIIEDGVSRDG